MSWIKRNLYFFIGSIVAVVLMGLAGFYLYSKWQLNNEIMEKLNQDYAELQRLNQENPHPGSGQVDNIKAAKQQQEQLRQLVQKIREHFERIPAIPDLGTNVTSQEYKSALDRTIAQLQRDATNASVILPPDYSFSFTAQRPRVTFAPGSLEPLSVQLGEVKAICDILFKAKINSLDNIRRVRVSPDDANGPQTEYLLKQSVTNELAILTPYEITFRCFSTELAAVLEGLGASRHGFLVKSLNVEPAVTTTPGTEFMPGVPTAFNPIEAPAAMYGASAHAGESAGARRRPVRRRGRKRRRLCPPLWSRPRRARGDARRRCGSGRNPPAAVDPDHARDDPCSGLCSPAGGAGVSRGPASAGGARRAANGAGRKATESHPERGCGETASSQVRWIFSRNITRS